MNTGMRYSFGKLKIIKDFTFETEPISINQPIFNVSRLSDDSNFNLSYNDFTNNFNTIFQNDEAVLNKWIGDNFDLIKTNETTADRNSFIRTYNSKPLIDASSTTNSGFVNKKINLYLTKPFVLHFIADAERSGSNQRITIALSDINGKKLLLQRRSGGYSYIKFGDFNQTLGEENNYAFNYSESQYLFKIHTLYFDGINPLRYFLNGVELSNFRVLGTNTGYFRTSAFMSKGILLNTRSEISSFRGKVTRYKYLSYKQINSSFNLQDEITFIRNQYNI